MRSALIAENSMSHDIDTGHTVEWQELAALFTAAGWGKDYDSETLQRAMRAWPMLVHARDSQGGLIGYLSAFSDGAFNTLLGELVVHPDARGQGIGRGMLAVVERKYAGVPIYIKALGEAKAFFQACGYSASRGEMTALFKVPRASDERT
jgi:GNAT superfamily N-acetyltransferase